MNEFQKPTPNPSSDNGIEPWAQDLIGRVAFAALIEQRRARRWGIFFKLLTFAYLIAVLWMIYVPLELADKTGLSGVHSALINIEGVIADDADASADNIITGLRAAFEDSETAGVILHINSPGGSPVQAGQVFDEIMRLREVHPDTPVYAVASDVCASGGYYIAAAAQQIYADKASILGSIGVRSDGFGFTEAMKKLGIERRLYTAGENKALLDPFVPERPQDIRFLENLLDEIHQQFIGAVRQGRGERLKDNPELFSGLVWTGEKSVELGLVDGLGTVRYVAEELIGAEEVVDFTPSTGMLERLLENVEARLSRIAAQTLRFSQPLPY